MSRLCRLVLFVLVAAAVVTPAHAQRRICVYDASYFANSLQATLGGGYNVVNIPAAQWGTKTLADFQACAAIYVPDTDNIQSGYSALNSNKTTWGVAVTGNVVISGVHLGGHGLSGGVGRVVQGLVGFVTQSAGNTGFVAGTDRGYDRTTNGQNGYNFASVFNVLGDTRHVCDDDIRIVSPLPAFLSNLTQPVTNGGFGVLQSDLANQGCSGHNFFPVRAAGVWTTFAQDYNQSPAEDIVLVRQAAQSSGQLSNNLFLFNNPGGGQVITPTGTTSFTFNLNRINNGVGIAVSNNTPGLVVIQICGRTSNGVGIVLFGGRRGHGTLRCR